VFQVRITAPDGTSRTVPFQNGMATIGRTPDNTVALEGFGVSSRHCQFELVGSQVTLRDCGSTNGTFLNGAPLDQPRVIGESDRVWVGEYLLQVVAGAAAPIGARPLTASPPGASYAGRGPERGGGGAEPIVRGPRADRAWRDLHGRLLRYAEQWEQDGRPDRLALRPTEQRQAERWLRQKGPEPVTELQREFIAASRAARKRARVKSIVVGVGSLVVVGGLVGTVAWWWSTREPDPEPEVAQTEPETKPPVREPEVIDEEEDPPPRPREDEDREKIPEAIEHFSIPQETIGDIAARYGVTVADIAEWNTINPDAPLKVGTKLAIKRPKKRSLPQQEIPYEIEPGETSWTKVSDRFNVSVQRLRSYNPKYTEGDSPKVGDTITVWVDPHPYAPKGPRRPVPDFEADITAVSIGPPNEGKLENGIIMPEDKNYIRRYPRLMHGSAYTVANLRKALVVADMSKPGGGKFNPHASHQSGRDVDIWLPTLRGVFKPKYLEGGSSEWGRRPNWYEVDWFATWAFIRALGDTGAVHCVFLDLTLHPKVYEAAKLMGATDEELERMIQWPNKRNTGKTLLQHSAAHTHHVHVRFKCAKYEKACRLNPTREEHE
jgi:pSer/pThr/pTyr-binding forkhead associated (FHA) protein